MNAIVLTVIGLGTFALGYRFYSKFLAERIFKLDPNFRTPAHAQEDGVDFVPTNKWVLLGHHFTSVAGAAPIVGPAIGVIWGWLPAFLWVTVGTVFFAGLHDAGAMWASVRNQGKSMGALTEKVVGKRARSLFMIIIFLLILLVNAGFALVIAQSFTTFPSSVIPAWFTLVVAVSIGYALYRRGIPLLWPSVIGVTLLYASMFVGDRVPVTLPSVMGLEPTALWILLLFAYAGVASILPVWLLLQPRDYINGLQLLIALGVFFTAVFIANPEIVAPAINTALPENTPPLVPLLFVTIACGAISGFHGLVSSGTTSKQLNNEADVRTVGYLGVLGEGALALASILACTAGFLTFPEWEGLYSSFAAAGITTFVQGGGTILQSGLGLPAHFSQTMLAVMIVLFAGTTMDTAVRMQRFIIQEWGQIYSVPVLQGRGVATLIAVASCLALAFGSGEGGTGGLAIWPLFGTANQLLAALILLVLSVYLMKLGRPTIYSMVPFTFIVVMTILSLLFQLRQFWAQGRTLLVVLDLVILVVATGVALEALAALARAKKDGPGGPPAEREEKAAAVG